MKRPIDKLVELLKQDKVIPVVGAGVSTATAGFPSWYGLIKNGFEFAENLNLEKELILKGQNKLKEGDFLSSSNYLKRVLDAPKFPFTNWIQENFEKPEINSTHLINSILDLCPQIILTTNYDTLLSSISNFSDRQKFIHSDYQNAIASIQRKEEIVVHLHGIYEKPESIILSEEDYASLNANFGYKAFLQDLLKDYHFLFIGCSKDGVMDEDFLPVFNFIKEWMPTISNQHYILLHDEQINNGNHIQLIRECNTVAISFGNDYSKIPEFINGFNPNFKKREKKFEAYQNAVKQGFKRLSTITNNFSENKEEVTSFIKHSLSSEYDWLESTKVKMFEEIITDHNNSINDKKQKLLFSQTIIQSLIDATELKGKIDLWLKYGDTPEKLDPLNFISTAIVAYNCLLRIPKEIVDDIRVSKDRYIFHNGFYDGYLGKFIDEIKRYKTRGIDLETIYKNDRYLFENLKRIIQSLQGFLKFDAEEFYTSKGAAEIIEELPNSFLVIATDREITLRDENTLTNVYAKLPIDKNFPPHKVDVIKTKKEVVVIAINSTSAYTWNPTQELTSNEFYKNGNGILEGFFFEKEEELLYVHTDKQIITFNFFFEQVNKLNLDEKFSHIIKFKTGFIGLKGIMNSTYRGNILFKIGETSEAILSIKDLESYVQEDEKLKELYADNGKEEFWSTIEASEIYKISVRNKEIVILRSKLILNQGTSLLFLFDINDKGLNLKNIIHLPESICFCLDIKKCDNTISLICGYLDCSPSEVMCELLTLNESSEIIENKKINHQQKREFLARDIYECCFINENYFILSEEGKKLMKLSANSGKVKEKILFEEERVKNVKFFRNNEQQ